jgi:hypothetical protein
VSLTKAQRNEIFHAAVGGGLNPDDCAFDGESYNHQFSIRHTPTKSVFTGVQKEADDYSVWRQLGTDPVELVLRSATWEEMMSKLQSWGPEILAWADIPELWSIKGNWQVLTDTQGQEVANSLFSQPEQEAIASQLAAIREAIKRTYELTAEQEAKIDAKFEEAEKASERLGRKDWILLFGGAVFSLILTDAITPDIAQHILMLAGHGLEHLFLSGPPRVRGILSAGRD